MGEIKKWHFIFKDRFWGSPLSIRKIEEALTWDINFGNNKQEQKGTAKLKTFLIAGGAGSGKETLSKMIGLFSSNHTFSKPYIFNMASLKPDWIAPLSLAGGEIKTNRENESSFLLYGIFKKVLDRAKKKSDENPIVILDELNSLHIDAQGTLLRILENSEVVPIGGLDEAVSSEIVEKLLIIGVVNELPPQLTLEDITNSFSQNRKLWGSLFGSALYEFYRGMRRLRDDLFYRFSRGGYIELPSLDERRQDIPIIFFTNLPKVLRDKLIKKEIFIEYDVWNLLTDERIKWKGNMRQVQAVADKIAREINNEGINVPLVKRVLEKMDLLPRENIIEDN